MSQGFPETDFPIGAILILGAILVTLMIEQAAAVFFDDKEDELDKENNNNPNRDTVVVHRLHSHHLHPQPEVHRVDGSKSEHSVTVMLPELSTNSTPTSSSASSPTSGSLLPPSSDPSPTVIGTPQLPMYSSNPLPSSSHGHSHGSQLLGMAKMGAGGDKRKIIVAHILELGIAFHSVIIGITTGVQTNGPELRALIAALAFHQFFEGFALGSAVLEANMKYKFYIYIMAFLFSISTPIGVAIGIGISSTYDEDSKSALVTEGVFDCISGGILIYMALVDLISEEFRDHTLKSSHLRLSLFLSVAFGSGCMSVLAIWA